MDGKNESERADMAGRRVQAVVESPHRIKVQFSVNRTRIAKDAPRLSESRENL